MFIIRVYKAGSMELVETVAKSFSEYKDAQRFVGLVMTETFAKKYICYIGTE